MGVRSEEPNLRGQTDVRDHDNDRDDTSHSCLERAGAGRAEGYHVEVPFFFLSFPFLAGTGMDGWAFCTSAQSHFSGGLSLSNSPFCLSVCIRLFSSLNTR